MRAESASLNGDRKKPGVRVEMERRRKLELQSYIARNGGVELVMPDSEPPTDNSSESK